MSKLQSVLHFNTGFCLVTRKKITFLKEKLKIDLIAILRPLNTEIEKVKIAFE